MAWWGQYMVYVNYAYQCNSDHIILLNRVSYIYSHTLFSSHCLMATSYYTMDPRLCIETFSKMMRIIESNVHWGYLLFINWFLGNCSSSHTGNPHPRLCETDLGGEACRGGWAGGRVILVLNDGQLRSRWAIALISSQRVLGSNANVCILPEGPVYLVTSL